MEDVVVKENVLNKPMYREPRFVLGEVPAPDSHYVPVLYSHQVATQNLRQINQDIYEAQKNAKPADRKKTPGGIKFLVGTLLGVGIIMLIKNLVKLRR